MTARPKRWRPAWPAVLRTCPAHGTFEGARCPSCGHEGSPLLDEEQRTRLSKFLSGALRHFPGDVGLEPDERGFVDVDALLAAARERYDFADEPVLLRVDAEGLREAGIEIHRRAATVYTCKRVPARFVEVEGRDR